MALTTSRLPVPNSPDLCHHVGRIWGGHGGQIMVQDKHAVSIDAARAELSRIPGSPHLDASERDRGFLAVIVEDALAARTKRIKAYTIATKAFGRD